MQTILIDEEFKGLLPAPDKGTLNALEENLLQNGCRDALVLWGETLVDGYNRYEICTRNNIPFNTVSKEFVSRDDALIWIITTQVARRNLTQRHLSYYRGRHFRAEKKIITNVNGNNQYKVVEYQNDTQPPFLGTADKLARFYKVSRPTINRDAKVSEAIDAIGETSPEVKRLILNGDAKIDKKVLAELSNKQPHEISELAASIEDGTYKKKKPEPPISAVAGEPGGSAPGAPEMYPPGRLDAAINRITDDSNFFELRKHTINNDPAGFRGALRSYIDMLEALYGQI